MPTSISTRLHQWILCHQIVPASASLDWAFLWGNAVFDCEIPEAERCETLAEFQAFMRSLGVTGLQFTHGITRKRRRRAAVAA